MACQDDSLTKNIIIVAKNRFVTSSLDKAIHRALDIPVVGNQDHQWGDYTKGNLSVTVICTELSNDIKPQMDRIVSRRGSIELVFLVFRFDYYSDVDNAAFELVLSTLQNMDAVWLVFSHCKMDNEEQRQQMVEASTCSGYLVEKVPPNRCLFFEKSGDQTSHVKASESFRKDEECLQKLLKMVKESNLTPQGKHLNIYVLVHAITYIIIYNDIMSISCNYNIATFDL